MCRPRKHRSRCFLIAEMRRRIVSQASTQFQHCSRFAEMSRWIVGLCTTQGFRLTRTCSICTSLSECACIIIANGTAGSVSAIVHGSGGTIFTICSVLTICPILAICARISIQINTLVTFARTKLEFFIVKYIKQLPHLVTIASR